MNKSMARSIIMLALITLVLFITGCKNMDTKEGVSDGVTITPVIPSETLDSEEEEISIVPTPGIESSIKDPEMEMIERSLFTTGNNYRMKKVIEKAKKGEDITIAYIGGSITEGYNAGTPDNFAKLTTEYFASTYGIGDNVHMVNAGLSGTPSTLGLIRADRDIFAYNPDIIFIEFAVNDAGSGTDPIAFESLIVKALKQEKEPAVVLLFSVIESGYTCQTQMSMTGFHYKLPMISVKDALQPEFDAGRMTWEDWSSDESHPNVYGHELYSKFIINYLDRVEAGKADEAIELPSKFKTRTDYSDMELIDKTNMDVTDLGSFHEESAHSHFPNGWVKAKDSTENESFQFTTKAKSLFIIYKEVKEATYGMAEVFVDGEKVANLAGKTSSGWGNPKTALVYSHSEEALHTIEIKMAEEDKDKAFAILGFGVCW